MKPTYLIDADNNVTLLSAADTDFEGEIFSSAEELMALAEKWPAGRLLEVRNSMPGIERAEKVNNTQKVCAMLWRTVAQLMKPAADAGKTALMPAHKPKPKGKAKTSKKSAPKAARAAKEPKRAKGAKKPAKGEAGDSKKAMVLAMIQRKGGATLDEICKTTGWQRHTVRGMMATVPRKLGLKVESYRNDQGQRTYAIR